MVRTMANSPAVVGHQNWRVAEVADQIIEPLVLGKGSMAAVVTDDE